MNETIEMSLSFTKHAIKRLRQRGIKSETIECLDKYGNVSPAPGGATKISLTRSQRNEIIRELKRVIELLEKASEISLVEKDGQIITGYRRH